MADVFISYAREDKQFVEKLNDELSAADRETWVDWEGILPTAEWLKEIYAAIESADTFVFVLSPDSVASEVCKKEIENAVSQHKRLIPLVWREVDPTAVPESLGRLNWVFFRERDDFHQAFQLLLEALDMDLEWIRAHTRLLVRAQEWQAKGRENSLVLRGNDLNQAEQWLGQSADKDPSPTTIQTQFIVVSRQVATKWQRVIIAGVTFGLILALVLAGVALFQRNEKEQQRQVAQARQLTVQSTLSREEQLDVALLLSTEANRIREQLEQEGVDEKKMRGTFIKGNLLGALEFSPHLQTYLHGHTLTVESVAFSPDGRTLASASQDGTIILWDVANQKLKRTLSTGYNKKVVTVAFNPGGTILASAYCREDHPKFGGVCRGEIQLWDTSSYESLGQPLRGHKWNVTSLAFSPDGKLLASGGGWGDNTLILWDVTTRESMGAPLRGHNKAVLSVAFHPDGETLASSSLDGSISLWDMTTHSLRERVPHAHSEPVWSLSFSPNGQYLASSGKDQVIKLWDANRLQLSGQPLHGHTAAIRTITFSPNGKMLVSGSRDNTLIVWDVAGRRQDGKPLKGHSNDIFSVAVSPDGHTVASGGVDGHVILWDLKQDSLGTPLIGHGGTVTSVAFAPGDEVLASGSADHTVRLWDVATSQLLKVLEGHKDSVESVAFSADGQIIASGSNDGSIRLWNALNYTLIHSLLGHKGSVKKIIFSSDGKILASGGADQKIMLWDVKKGQSIGEPLVGHTAPMTNLAMNVAEGILLSSDSNGEVRNWNLAKRESIGSSIPVQKEGIRDHVFSTAFNADGWTFASVRLSGIHLVDAMKGEENVKPLLDHGPLANVAAFSTNGNMFASGRRSKRGNFLPTVLLWDLTGTRPEPIGFPLKGHSKTVTALAFSKNGELLASSSEDHTVRLWDLSVASWASRACQIVKRNLTENEWADYVGAEPYHKTCGDVQLNRAEAES